MRWSLVLVLLGLAILTSSSLAIDTPKVQVVKGEHIMVPVGSTVKVYTTIHASGGPIKGWLKVEVRKDYQNYPDDTYVTLKKYVEIPADTSKTIYMGTFVANDKTGEPWWAPFREYFVKVYFNDKCIYDPKDPDSREWVRTY